MAATGNTVFEQLPKDFAKSVYPMWRDKLDQRFVAALADADVTTLAEFPAKLSGLTKGVEGSSLFGEDRIVFRCAKAGASRTWRFTDIDNIASAGPFDFSVLRWSIMGLERGHQGFPISAAASHGRGAVQ